MATGKTIALTMWTFVGKVMSLFFNVIYMCQNFPSKEKAFLNFMFAVILEPKKIKCVTVSTIFPSICHEVMGLDAMIFVF